MNIGFDLDGIFIATPPFVPRSIIGFLYRKQGIRELIYRYPPKMEQLIRKFSHKRIFRPAILKNIKFLSSLAQTNSHMRYLISGRFGFIKNETEQILRYYGLDRYFNEYFLNYKNQQPHVFKDEIIKQQVIDMYIDEDRELIEFLASRNSKTKFFWLNNKEKKQLRENLFAITELSQMFT